MKQLLLALSIVIGLNAYAQNDADYLEYSRSVLKSEKKAMVSEAMQLTEDQSKIFWPLYNEYNDKLYQIEGRVYELILDYANNYETMTDTKADELWKAAMTAEAERLKLSQTYYTKFKKALPAGLVVKYFQVENKIDVMVDAALALEIPLIEVQPEVQDGK